MKNPFQLWKRGNIWYYRLPEEKTFHSTGETSKMRAVDLIYRKLQEGKKCEQTFKEYAEPFFIWETCPRVQRRLNEGKSIGRTHVQKSRRWLEMYVFPDRFSTLKMHEIRRSHILDLRERLKKKAGINTLNKIISTVKTVHSEAYFREDIDRDPGSRIGIIKHEKLERGVLTKEELSSLFSEIPGPWSDLLTYSVFNLAAKTGMRCGEVLALMWIQVVFDRSIINIDQAWKDTKTIGLPKSNKKRSIPVVNSLLEPLLNLHEASIRIGKRDLVFCYDDGSRLGTTWWRKNFYKSLVRAGIASREARHYRNAKGRKQITYKYQNVRGEWITPHSLRHSLNTHLLDCGCDPVKIRAYFGWSENILLPTLTTVQKGYTHWEPDRLKDILPAIDGIFS